MPHGNVGKGKSSENQNVFTRFLSKERVERNRVKNTPCINRKGHVLPFMSSTPNTKYRYVHKYALAYHEEHHESRRPQIDFINKTYVKM